VYVDILILATLAARPQHGYELKRSVGQVLGPDFSLNNGALYPALRRFEEMGAVERTVERQFGKPDRHIYSITALGREILHDLVCEFPPEIARSEAEFLVRVAFFDQLEPRERLAILSVRETVLRDSVAHHERILEMVAAEPTELTSYAQQTLAFRERLLQLALDWIAELRRDAIPE
jgi:DNA-binding PadR family transcriptional regulator